MKLLILVFVAITIVLCVAQNNDNGDGRYADDNSGQYIPDNSGQYIPDDSGRYIDDGTGRYADDGTGRYKGDNNAFGSGFRGFRGNDNFLGSGTTNQKFIRPRPAVIPVPAPAAPRPVVRQSEPINYNTRNNYQDGKLKIIRQLSDIDTDGYHWEYETENKIIAEESGKVHNKGTDQETMRAKGSYQYTGPDNVVYSVQYTADENGFVPVGQHLPTPPPIPEAIAKALDLDRRNNRL